jgi:hypothetical protein
VLVQTGHAHWRTWAHFSDAVRIGATQTRKALGADVFDYYARPENAEEAALFSHAMADLSGLVTAGRGRRHRHLARVPPSSTSAAPTDGSSWT